MAQQGWYPDPGGQAGMYRYWDGSAWSDTLSPTPMAPPPYSSYGAGYQPIQTGQNSYFYPTGQSLHPDAYNQYTSLKAEKPKRPVGPWLILIAVIVVLALVIWFAVTKIFGLGAGTGGDEDNPGSNSTTAVCPTQTTSETQVKHPTDNRVYGGKLSYPQLGSPWSGVLSDNRVPFGRDVASQNITIHANYDNMNSWVASILVGELYAGDGFYDPQQGSEIVNKCIFGAFYGDAQVTPETRKSEAYTLDGYSGWITVTNLTFSIPNLATTSELVTVIIVKTSDMSSSLFYSSIPGDASQYNADVDKAIAGLRVEPT